jgi:hypothetical protein
MSWSERGVIGGERCGHRAAKNALRETQVWCTARADLARPKECFRTEKLRPQPLLPTRFTVVDDVRQNRSRLLGYQHSSSDPCPEVATAGGRLIAYSPDANLACGVSEVETEGYFDVNNTPPWDTWVALVHAPMAQHFETSLIAWVPPMFVRLSQSGIDVIPEGCVMWLDDCPQSLRQMWREVVETDTEQPWWFSAK